MTPDGYDGRGNPARGAGPGTITPDGCAVDFYAMLRAGPEPDIIHRAVGAGGSILDLGAGAGRITHPLVELGHEVVAVDESAEMLAHIRGAEVVRSPIETLDLGRRFDGVLLASHLVNTPDREQRQAFLRTCRRHVRDGGCVVIQRHDPDWFATAAPSRRVHEGVTYEVRDIERPADGLISATAVYTAGERRWTQTFVSRRLDDGDLAAELAAAGLAFDRVLTGDRTWVRAVPAEG